jgi:cation diffusion facilitator family transporter
VSEGKRKFSGAGSTIVCLRVCLASNVGLAALKFFAGITGHSHALIADAMNSLLDVISSTVAWLGHHISLRPPDERHPYGHGNADVLAAVFVGIVVFGTGLFVARGAWLALIDRTTERPTMLPVIVAVGVIIIKAVLFKYADLVAAQSRSPAVQASAVDHKSDVLATSAALVGVVGARAGVAILDPLAALAVAVLIIYHAVRMLYGNVHILMSGQPATTQLNPIKQTLIGIPEIKGLHRTRARTLGSRIIIYAEILVDGSLSVNAGHEVAAQARRIVLEHHPEVMDVVVHVEPLEPFRAATAEVREGE